MKVRKIFIKRTNINKMDPEERSFFYMSSWFLSEVRTLKSLYFFSMDVKNAHSIEVYGRNYRTMLIGCLLGAKLWEGWLMLQKGYFSSNIHSKYEPLYSEASKEALTGLKKYFDKGKRTIIGKIRHSTFHYPLSRNDKNELEKFFKVDIKDDREGTDYYIGDFYEQSIFSIDQFIASVLNATKAKDVKEAIKVLNREIQKVVSNFCQFLGGYIMLFQKKCGFTEENMEFDNVAIRKEISIPFFCKEK